MFGGRVDIGSDEFVPTTEVRLKFTPQALGPADKGMWVKAHLVLSEGFAVDDVNANIPATLRFLGAESQSEYMNIFINEDGLVEIEAAFDRAAFCTNGPAEGTVKVIGLFTNGHYFYGTDSIKIINNSLKKLAVLASHWLRPDCRPPDWCDGLDLDHDSTVNFIDLAMLDACCIEIVTQ